ncbi:hypothetical protein HBNXHx_1713 [Haloferax volcanii]|nr:hypothetical protein HBNXHx_1713 [Haloferax alexandrinus]
MNAVGDLRDAGVDVPNQVPDDATLSELRDQQNRSENHIQSARDLEDRSSIQGMVSDVVSTPKKIISKPAIKFVLIGVGLMISFQVIHIPVRSPAGLAIMIFISTIGIRSI